ncbi:hypothetical protein TWF718_001379 [Orbilia javanica]|uniref:Uncharacterized protein n=1 Tax=Orbilia javanica TaxID=47235 RepID=A0AAN8NHI7_9PEZI
MATLIMGTKGAGLETCYTGCRAVTKRPSAQPQKKIYDWLHAPDSVPGVGFGTKESLSRKKSSLSECFEKLRILDVGPPANRDNLEVLKYNPRERWDARDRYRYRAHGVQTSLSVPRREFFLQELLERYACPFAVIDATGNLRCLPVNRRDVADISLHLKHHHGLHDLPDIDDAAGHGGPSQWQKLFISVCLHSGLEPSDTHPDPYFKFERLFEGLKKISGFTDKEIGLYKKRHEDAINLNKLVRQQLCKRSAPIYERTPQEDFSQDISEKTSTTWVLDYISALLTSKYSTRDWLWEFGPLILEPLAPLNQQLKVHTRPTGNDDAKRPASINNSGAREPSGGRGRGRRGGGKKREWSGDGEGGGGDGRGEGGAGAGGGNGADPKRQKRIKRLEKRYRCPYEIIGCPKHGKCSKDGKPIARSGMSGLREHLRDKHNKKVPPDMTWEEVFDECVKEPCDEHAGWVFAGFASVCYVEVATKAAGTFAVPTKVYTREEAKKLFKDGEAYREPTVFTYSATGGLSKYSPPPISDENAPSLRTERNGDKNDDGGGGKGNGNETESLYRSETQTDMNKEQNQLDPHQTNPALSYSSMHVNFGANQRSVHTMFGQNLGHSDSPMNQPRQAHMADLPGLTNSSVSSGYNSIESGGNSYPFPMTTQPQIPYNLEGIQLSEPILESQYPPEESELELDWSGVDLDEFLKSQGLGSEKYPPYF